MSNLYTFRLSPLDAHRLAQDMDAAGYTDRTAYIKRKLFGPPGERREFATQLESIDEHLHIINRRLAGLAKLCDIEKLLRDRITQPANSEAPSGQYSHHEIDEALGLVGISPRTRETVLDVLNKLDIVVPIGSVSAKALIETATSHGLDMDAIAEIISILQEIGAMPVPKARTRAPG